jgi:hypothetical protein
MSPEICLICDRRALSRPNCWLPRSAAATGRVLRGAPLGLNHRADDLPDPFALEELVLDELRLTTHPQALHDSDGRDISWVAFCNDPVEAQPVKPQPKHLPGTFRGEAASLDVRMHAPADLTLTALGARQAEHELTDHPARLAFDSSKQERVPVRLDVRLPDALLDLGTCLVDVHRFLDEVAAHVLPAEHVVEGREIAHLVRPKGHPRRSERVRGFQHPQTLPGQRTLPVRWPQMRIQQLQIRDNTKVLRTQAHYNALLLAQRPFEMLIDDEGLAKVVNVGYANPDVLSDDDWARCGCYFFMQFNASEYLYHQNRDGSIPMELWVSTVTG